MNQLQQSGDELTVVQHIPSNQISSCEIIENAVVIRPTTATRRPAPTAFIGVYTNAASDLISRILSAAARPDYRI